MMLAATLIAVALQQPVNLAQRLADGKLRAVNREVARLPGATGAVRVTEKAGPGVVWLEGSDFAGTFGHGLGHGLGLDVHESPRLSTESSDTLVAGNVVTVEPGVYLAGRFGIRIEDDVVVTDDGIENPVGFTKELLTVG